MEDGYCDPQECEYLSPVKKQFFSLRELKYFENLLDHISQLPEESQEEHFNDILDRTVFNNLNRKYPIRKSYQLAFVNLLKKEAEDLEVDFGKGYWSYCQILQNKLLKDTCFKHYFADDRVYTLKEKSSFVSDGTTGFCTWGAAIALTNWVLEHDYLISDKNVLELGCGVGLTGIVLLSSSNFPRNYVFTDHHSGVLDLVKENLCINDPLEPEKHFPKCVDNVRVDLLPLEWEDKDAFEEFNNYEVILGADIVFDPELIELLADVLEILLNTQEKVAIIAYTVRNQETVDIFIKNIESRGLTIKQQLDSYPQYLDEKLYRSDSENVNIYVINKRDSPDNSNSD